MSKLMPMNSVSLYPKDEGYERLAHVSTVMLQLQDSLAHRVTVLDFRLLKLCVSFLPP